MMELLAKITKLTIDNKLIKYEELYYMDEPTLFDKMINSKIEELIELVNQFQNIALSDIPVITLNNVKIRDLSDNSETTYRITSTVEADPMNNVISNESPLGKALFGKRVGDIAVVKVAEEYSVEILAIEK